jgi:hypothetical protein
MRCCKCGSEIKNFPEHLEGLADVVCQECAGSHPAPVDLESVQERYTRGRPAIGVDVEAERNAA